MLALLLFVTRETTRHGELLGISLKALERTYFRVWGCGRIYGEDFKEVGFRTGVDA